MGARGGKSEFERRFDEEVGRRVTELRKQQGFSGVEFARALKILPAQLYAYEIGITRLSPMRLRMIAGRCGVDVGSLIPKLKLLNLADRKKW